MKDISKEMQALIAKVAKNVEEEVMNSEINKALDLLLAAFNRYQEDERDGVDYIFDLSKQKDLKCMVEGGLSASEICDAWSTFRESDGIVTPFVRFGQNYTSLQFVGTRNDLKKGLIGALDDFLPYVFMYVCRCKEYQDFYEHFVTNNLDENHFCSIF